jgi:16S rRNA (uracil1498-N3)-methyltransferase
VRRLRRFHVQPEAIDGARVTFDRETVRHIARVLRLGPGVLITASDGAGQDYLVRLESVTAEQAVGTILGKGRHSVESPLQITLGQGLPKADKMQAIIRATTELGVARIAPIVGQRTVVRLEGPDWSERARRWQRVARAAAEQSGRSVVPSVEAPRPLLEFLDTVGPETVKLCLSEHDAAGLGTVLASFAERPSRVTVLVGPEGGWAPGEIEIAQTHGFRTASLGPRTLRTETVGPSVISILQLWWGDLSGHCL